MTTPWLPPSGGRSPGSATFLVPGSLATLTGGYGYDRCMINGLRSRGWTIDVRELDDSFPRPTPAARVQAEQVLASIPDGTVVVADGLALGVLADEAAAHASRLRLVALVHHPLAAETGIGPGEAAQFRESERRALAHARAVIVTSAPTGRMLAAYDVPDDRIVVINPGTNPAPASPGSGEGELQLLCVATLIPRKGHEVLFRALVDLPAKAGSHAQAGSHRFHLTCVGSLDRDPHTVARLRAMLDDLDLADRETLAGERDDRQLEELYVRADVFVLPTLYEGYGMVVAEALAHGLPIVATRTGAIGDLVTEDAGILVPPGDVKALARAITRLFDPETRTRLAAGARARREVLPTWEQSVSTMADVLAAVGT